VSAANPNIAARHHEAPYKTASKMFVHYCGDATSSIAALATRTRDGRSANRAPRIPKARARAPGPPFRTPAAATTWFHLRLSALPCEVVAVAWLDIHLRLIEFREIFRGTVTGATVHVREAVMTALACNAV
jgi:DNA repair protein RadC